MRGDLWMLTTWKRCKLDEDSCPRKINGYQRDYPKQVEQFRIRDYFADADGNQYEFVQYLSEVVSEKNSYKN